MALFSALLFGSRVQCWHCAAALQSYDPSMFDLDDFRRSEAKTADVHKFGR